MESADHDDHIQHTQSSCRCALLVLTVLRNFIDRGVYGPNGAKRRHYIDSANEKSVFMCGLIGERKRERTWGAKACENIRLCGFTIEGRLLSAAVVSVFLTESS